jgi:hypothetical protein
MEALSEDRPLFPVDDSVASFLRLLHAADCFPRGDRISICMQSQEISWEMSGNTGSETGRCAR